MWSNYHTHTQWCDGKEPEDIVVDVAIQSGLHSLGFSSHAPLPFECKWCMPADDLSDYLLRFQSLKETSPIDLYVGLEVDFIPGVTGPANFADKLDYTIGSIHFVDGDDRPWEIDGQHDRFLEGLTNIFGNNVQQAISRYYALTREMVTTDRPTIVGHLDKIKIQNIGEKLFKESDRWYEDEIRQTLTAIKDSGSLIEINTRGWYQGKSQTTYPSPWIIRLAMEQDIPLVLNSDAHHSKDLTGYFQEASGMLAAIGVSQLFRLNHGEWEAYELHEGRTNA